MDDGSSRLALGLVLGMVYLRIDGSMLNLNDPEIFEPVGVKSTVLHDAKAGICFAHDKFSASFSADNLTTAYVDRYAFSPQPKPYFLFNC